MRSGRPIGRCHGVLRNSGKSSARNAWSTPRCSLALPPPGLWWAYPLLWLVPLLTWMMVITRIRNIAEHAVVPDSNDPLRNTRTTRANILERLFIAPYYVNYHLEHHLLFHIPARYNLPRVHRILSQGRFAGGMEVQPGYAAVLRLATAKPNQEDRPGQLVNSLRRAGPGRPWVATSGRADLAQRT